MAWGGQDSQTTLTDEAGDRKLHTLDIVLQHVPGDSDGLKAVDTPDQETRDNFQNIAWPPQDEPVHVAVGNETVVDLGSGIAVGVDSSSRLSTTDGSTDCFDNQVWTGNSEEVSDLPSASELSLFNQSSSICGAEVSEDQQVLIEESYEDSTHHVIGSCASSSALYTSETVQIPVQFPTLCVDSSDTSVHQEEQALQDSASKLMTASTADITVEQQQQQQLPDPPFPPTSVGNIDIAWKDQLQNVTESPGLLVLTANKETGAYEASVIISPFFKVKAETEVKTPSAQLPEVIPAVQDNISAIEAAGNAGANNKLTVVEEEKAEHDGTARKQTESVPELTAMSARGILPYSEQVSC